jgi:hypothetical protein
MKKKAPCFQVVFLSALLGAVLSTAGCSLPRSARTEGPPGLEDVLESYREQVSHAIEDPERAGQLVGLGEELALRLQKDGSKLREMAEELRRHNARYDTTREEFVALLTAINEHRRRMGEEVLAARAEAVSLTTPDEWRDLMSRRKTLIDLIRETPGLL